MSIMPARAPEEDSFKGYPILNVFTGKEFKGEDEKIVLGLRKAKAIVDNIDHIRIFVEKHSNGGA